MGHKLYLFMLRLVSMTNMQHQYVLPHLSAASLLACFDFFPPENTKSVFEVICTPL